MNHCIGFLIFRINIINNCWIIKCHYGREIFWCNVIITTRENEDPFPNVQMCSAETGQTGASHHCWPVASIFCQNYFPLCRQASWAQTCYISSPGPTAPWELRRKMATINILLSINKVPWLIFGTEKVQLKCMKKEIQVNFGLQSGFVSS